MKLKKLIKRGQHKINSWYLPKFQSNLPLWCFPKYSLRFKCYCVGAGRTGTTSIHKIFSQQYRSAHEPERPLLIHQILRFAHGKIDKNKFIQYIKQRDRRLGLEMDSSHLNYHLLDILLSEFNEAKFILTIRDCYSWLNSLLNYQYAAYSWLRAQNNLINKPWLKIDQLDFRASELKHKPEEKFLAEKGLYTLEGYLSYWQKHNMKVLTTVPPERLLIVKTAEINTSIPRIEEFLGISVGTLPSKNIHENAKSKNFNFLAEIDSDFLEEQVHIHCQELMAKYFPEITSCNV